MSMNKKSKHIHEIRPSIFWFGLLVCDGCHKFFTRKLDTQEYEELHEIVFRKDYIIKKRKR